MAAAAAVMFLLASCATDAKDVVTETADNLEELRSGLLELRVSATAAPGEEETAEAGFELIGSFQLPEEGALPVADLEYTDVGADEPVTQGFISTGDQAFIEVEGQAYELPPETTQTLLGGGGDDQSVFEGASIDEWLIDPQLEEGESLDGAEVDRVSGELDVIAALNDLFDIAARFGPTAGFTTIEGDEVERLENAVESSHMEIISGSEDRLLRRLLIEVELALDEEVSLAEVLGPLAGTSFTIDMSISEPNQPIEVEAPADPLPLEELSGG
jgi:hypothetical protein